MGKKNFLKLAFETTTRRPSLLHFYSPLFLSTHAAPSPFSPYKIYLRYKEVIYPVVLHCLIALVPSSSCISCVKLLRYYGRYLTLSRVDPITTKNIRVCCCEKR